MIENIKSLINGTKTAIDNAISTVDEWLSDAATTIKTSLGGATDPIDNFVQEGIENGHIKAETDLLFYGRETRPIHKALAYTNDPYLSGLSSEEDKCLSFLLNLGIELRHKDRWRTLTDLTTDEKQKLFSEIAKLLSSKGIPNDVTFSLIGTVYTLIDEDRWTSLRNGREYASLLNACGRMNKAGLGVILCMGDRGEVLNETLEVLDSYRKKKNYDNKCD